MMRYQSLGPVQVWSDTAEPDPVTITGTAASVWEDSSDATFVTVAKEFPFAYPAVEVETLPLTVQQADAVGEIEVTWTAWYSGTLPGLDPDVEGLYVQPLLTRGLAFGPIDHLRVPDSSLVEFETLRLSTEPQTYTQPLVPTGESVRSIAQILSDQDLSIPDGSLDPETFYLQMRVVDVMVGTDVQVHISEVKVRLSSPDAAPLALTPAETQIAATWTAATGVLSEVKIGRPGDWRSTESLPLNTNAHTFTNLTADTTYTVAVRTLDADGDPTAWISQEATTGTPPVPGLRPHYQRSLRVVSGPVVEGSTTVDLLEPGTQTPIVQTVYQHASGTQVRGSTWAVESGIVDFYLEDPQVVDIRVTIANGQQTTFVDQWVGDPENQTYEGLPTAGAEPGMVPIADGVGGWEWGFPVSEQAVQQIVRMSSADYLALPSPDPRTLYVMLPEGPQ